MPPVAPDASDDVAGSTFLTGLDNDETQSLSRTAPPKSSQTDRMAASTGRAGAGDTLPYIHKLTSSTARLKEKAASPYNVPNKHMRVYFPK